MQEILPEPHEDCGWVFAGEGVATRMYDGTCCLLQEGKFYKRREIKKGIPLPFGFIQADFDEVTGKTVGWVEIEPTNREDKWHMLAFREGMEDGTYELLGPKIQGNPEGLTEYVLFKHSQAKEYLYIPRTFRGLREWLSVMDIEGLVFHHSDGRMAKIKKKDYGLRRR